MIRSSFGINGIANRNNTSGGNFSSGTTDMAQGSAVDDVIVISLGDRMNERESATTSGVSISRIVVTICLLTDEIVYYHKEIYLIETNFLYKFFPNYHLLS